MAYARVISVGLDGVHGYLVEVEADISNGLPGVVVTGLPDAMLVEARQRIRSAVINSGESWPNRRMTINLLPASLRKHGTGFDLAVAVAVLAAATAVRADVLDGAAVIGELGLDGRVQPVRGMVPAVIAASQAGVERVVVPAGNAAEAQLVPGMRVAAVTSLRELVDVLRGHASFSTLPAVADDEDDRPYPDLGEVVGQELGRRAVEVAAAGAHHAALFGPPGAGKTMLAERLPFILPRLDDEAALEVTAVHSVAGTLTEGGLVRIPPYQAPHHTATVPALVGGGSGQVRPGAVSLAHRGVLFLDEAPEFGRRVLDALREPLEQGEVTIARARGSVRFPARCQLVLAANPCPCATPAGDRHCTCTAAARRRYLGQLSGPLLDRLDVQVELFPVTSAQLAADFDATESSAVVADRVAKARAAAAGRWAVADTPWRTNAEVPGELLRSRGWRLPSAVTSSLTRYLDTGALSARGYDRVLRIAWTIADLAGRDRPDAGDINEATFLRMRQTAA